MAGQNGAWRMPSTWSAGIPGLGELADVLPPRSPGLGVVVVGRLVHRELADLAGAELGGRVHGEGCPRGVTVEAGGAAGLADQYLKVVDLPADRVRLGVPAVPPAAAVIAVDSEVRREQRLQFRLGAEPASAQGAVDQYQGRAVALPVIGDLRAVSRRG